VVLPLRATTWIRRGLAPVLGALADDVPPLVALHHVGRTSGRRYRTPVLAFLTPRGVVIALTYGPRVQWLRNVEAANGARMVRARRVLVLAEPRRLHGVAGAVLVPAWTRAALRLLRVDEFVELELVRELPAGTGASPTQRA
jgi:deazaflavin-dependent oxidoreductase (nitroreductase family)